MMDKEGVNTEEYTAPVHVPLIPDEEEEEVGNYGQINRPMTHAQLLLTYNFGSPINFQSIDHQLVLLLRSDAYRISEGITTLTSSLYGRSSCLGQSLVR